MIQLEVVAPGLSVPRIYTRAIPRVGEQLIVRDASNVRREFVVRSVHHQYRVGSPHGTDGQGSDLQMVILECDLVER